MVKLGEGGTLPVRSKPGDAGLDLYVSRSVVARAKATTDVHTDVYMEIPYGWYARIVGRSSTLRRRHLLVIEGIIDTGYRGELFVGVYNPTDKDINIQKGERPAQIILARNWNDAGLTVVEVSKLKQSERGENGFGSTGI